MKYSQQQAIALAKRVEQVLSRACLTHCALGGSCLYAGESDKDIDLILYPHDCRESVPVSELKRQIKSMGFTLEDNFPSPYPPDKVILRGQMKEVRVDFLCFSFIDDVKPKQKDYSKDNEPPF